MSQKRASSDVADELHALTFEILTAEIKRYKKGEVVDENGKPLPIPTALLAQAIKVLKDNGVDMPARTGVRVDTLKDAMPDLDEVERGNVVAFKK